MSIAKSRLGVGIELRQEGVDRDILLKEAFWKPEWERASSVGSTKISKRVMRCSKNHSGFPDVIMTSENRKIEDDDSDLLFRNSPTLLERIIFQPIRRKRCQDSGCTHIPTIISTLQVQAELHQIKLIVNTVEGETI